MPAAKYVRSTLVEVLVYHYRRDNSSCGCGWAELGRSHPEHVADVYEASVTMHGDSAGGPMSAEPHRHTGESVQRMDKAVTALALEVPAEVWTDVAERWQAVRDEVGWLRVVLDEIRTLHIAVVEGQRTWCNACGTSWPCKTKRHIEGPTDG